MQVDLWVHECFGADVARDVPIRCMRFIEEALELVQAAGLSKDDVLKVVDYTYSRPKGELAQECAGVVITHLALCNALDIDANQVTHAELRAVQTPERMGVIRAKQANKPAPTRS